MPSVVCTGQATIVDANDGLTITLTNEAVVVAAAPDGTVASLSGVVTTATVLLGGVDDSANWTLTAGTTSGMTGTLSGKTYTVTGVSSDTAYVDLTASRTGYASLTKRFSVSKSKQGVTGAPGADGVSPITVTLSNSAHTVPTDSAGNNGNFTGCNTTLNVFNGITNDSANWTVTAAATNLTGSLSGKTYTVTALSADVGYVDLTAARSGYTSQTARFTVSKSKTGAAGQTPTTYWMVRSASAIKKSAAGAYTPASITFTGKSQTGTAAPANYAGRFVISTSTDGTTWTAAYTSAADESSKSYTPPAGISAVKAALYLAGGTSTLLDEEVIPVVVDGTNGVDGAKGDTGAKGDQGPSVTVTANRAMSFTSTDGTLDTSQADIVFTAATSGITSPTYAWTFAGLQTNPTASTTATQTVTAAQFGTSRSATVTCTVGTYKQTLTIVRLEKSTADAGATVGADATNFTGTLGGDNLALNSEFERRSSTHTPTGYAVYNNSGSGTATFVASTGITGSGAGVKAGATPGSTLGISSNTTLGGGAEGGWVANETYVVSFYAKKVAGAGFSGTVLRWNVQPATSVALLNPVLTASYQRYAFRITWGATVESNGGFFLTREGSTVAGDEIHFDRLMIQRGDVLMDWAPSRRDGIRATTGATAPADPIDGDTWVDTSTTPNVTKIRVSGSWQIGGNYTTNTNQLTDGAGLGTTATWSGVGSMPANISTAGSNTTVDLRNNQIGLNASGQLYGAGAGNGTTISNAQIYVDEQGALQGVAAGTNGLGVANHQAAFSFRHSWDFQGVADGWTTHVGTSTLSADALQLTSVSGNPHIQRLGLSFPGVVFDRVRVRIRRTSGSTSSLQLFWRRSGDATFDEARSMTLVQTLSSNWTVYEFNLSGQTTWTDAVIEGLMFKTWNAANTAVEIDWLAVGKISPDVNLTYLPGTLQADHLKALTMAADSRITAGTDTNGVMLDASSKSLQVVAGGNERVRLGNQPTAVNGSAYGMVVKDTSGNVVFDSRNNVGIVGNPVQDNYNVGDSTTNPLWNGNTGGTNNIAIGARALQRDGLTLPTDPALMRYSIAIGTDALRYATAGENVGVGFSALRGTVAGFSGMSNVAVGYNAMQAVTTAANNVAVGRGSLTQATTASGNVAVGHTAMNQSSTAVDTVAVGRAALAASNGTGNVGVGKRAGVVLTTGNENTLVGADAGAMLTTGSGNTYIGTKAGNTRAATTENTVVIASGLGDALVIDSSALAKIYGNKVWHEGNDGTGSGLDADLLDGYQAAITATASTVAVRDGSGDIHTRLIRSEYGNETTISGALAYRVESTSGGNNYVRFCSDTAAIRTYLGVAAATHSHTMPAVGDWFNGGYMSIRSDGVMQAGKFLDWHNAGTDTNSVGRTSTDASGNLTHSAGLKVKGTSGLGYAFGGAVTQLTSRDTGVTLDTPSGTITLFSTTVTAGTMNKFTLTNSCITALDVVVVGVRASNSGTFNVFVNRTNAGVCDIVVQNLVTVATAQAVHINFAIIKGSNS